MRVRERDMIPRVWARAYTGLFCFGGIGNEDWDWESGGVIVLDVWVRELVVSSGYLLSSFNDYNSLEMRVRSLMLLLYSHTRPSVVGGWLLFMSLLMFKFQEGVQIAFGVGFSVPGGFFPLQD